MAKQRKHLQYQKELCLRREATDPYKELANAIVERAAVDYREYMEKKLTRGLTMSDIEFRYLESNILELKLFFESDWGLLLSHGLAPVIWEKLQAEFANQLSEFNRKMAKRKQREAEEAQRKEAAENEQRQKKA